jgi:predicted Na+-dependent transporter
VIAEKWIFFISYPIFFEMGYKMTSARFVDTATNWKNVTACHFSTFNSPSLVSVANVVALLTGGNPT